MREKIKLALRKVSTSSKLDEEIDDTIAACYADMQRVGIKIPYTETGTISKTFEKRALIIECQKLYAKWKFNFEGEAERYERAYICCRDALSLSGEYNA